MAEEILTDHPDRYRGMIVESANPAHSTADTKKFVKAMRSLECTVVIDVAMTETARNADYVLPASTQYEKAEATFFNFEYPNNYFHLRHPIFNPPEGSETLPEAEIHSRLLSAIGEMPEEITLLKAHLKEHGRKGFLKNLTKLQILMEIYKNMLLSYFTRRWGKPYQRALNKVQFFGAPHTLSQTENQTLLEELV